jgi:hypothetical protein
MAPIMRSAPGERVEIAGQYVLVGHYGEATGIVPKWIDKGEQFPLLGVSSEAGPMWYVRLYDTAEAVKAA